MTELQKNIFLHLFNGEHRPNRFATLCDHDFQIPVAPKAAANGAHDNAVVKEQGAMRGIMRAGNATEFGRGWVGVIQAANEIIDGA